MACFGQCHQNIGRFIRADKCKPDQSVETFGKGVDLGAASQHQIGIPDIQRDTLFAEDGEGS